VDPYAAHTRLRGLAVAAAGLGFLSLVLFWWFPIGAVLGVAGLISGSVCWTAGIRGGARGERYSLGGLILSGAGLGVSLAVGCGTFYRVFGF
jgi:hypothetical protein